MTEVGSQIVAALRQAPGNTAAIRSVRKRLSKELADADRSTVLRAAREIIDQAPFAKFAAYELVLNHAATMASITPAEVEELGRGFSGWADVDSFACFVSGPAWRRGRITTAAIRAWAESEDRWWRRAALVSTVPLNAKSRGGTGDTARTLEICALLVADRDDMVFKALSWALRELTKRDPASVRQFLARHREKLASQVIREVTNKLATGLKNPRRGSAAGRYR